METENKQKQASIFRCEVCDYTTSKLCNYKSHIVTNKHKKHKMETFETINQLNPANIKEYICLCGKKYANRSGMWKHKQNCSENNNKNDTNSFDSNLMVQLLKQNDEFKTMLLEQNKTMIETVQEVCKNGINNNTTNNVNSNNKAFNLNVFLNETCKDAMDVNDFIDSFKLQL
jgi:hypothetical protein